MALKDGRLKLRGRRNDGYSALEEKLGFRLDGGYGVEREKKKLGMREEEVDGVVRVKGGEIEKLGLRGEKRYGVVREKKKLGMREEEIDGVVRVKEGRN